MKVFAKEKKGIEYEINPLIRQRWSPSAFSEEKVAKETLGRLLEAARWAPSSFNEQPWHFIYAHREDEESFQKLLDCLSYNNQEWAGEAAVLMIAVASTHLKEKDKPNPHAEYDVGQAVAYLTMQAYFENLGVHQMAGFNADKAKETFDIQGNYEPITAIALGYIGHVEKLPDKFEDREFEPQKRKPQNSFVFEAAWNPEA